MSRFGRLEFDDHSSRRSSADVVNAHKQVDADERHWVRQADNERREGLYENALRFYSRALELDRSLVEGWVGQVQMLLALGEYPEARVWATKALELFRNNADLLAGRAQALCRAGDMAAAQASCDAAIGQPGLSAGPWIARGELMVAQNNKLDLYCFDKAVQLSNDWLVSLEIGDIYLHYDRPTKAIVRIRHAVAIAPDVAHCWYRQAECELALGLAAPARLSFDRCLQIKPNHPAASARMTQLRSGGGGLGRLLRRMFKR
jgi:tetratricopeptide (TPR) repeat protein